ncbi:MAG: DUF3789 domain-containing protein [Lachnospiraceae bacterium]|nr:DUF3789 domain-containing protein [Lachnospiraceae bacterium]
MLTHFIAFCAGGFFGVVVMCMCFAAGEEDRRIGESRHSESCQSTVPSASDARLAPTGAKRRGSACVPQQSCGTNSGCYDEKGGKHK